MVDGKQQSAAPSLISSRSVDRPGNLPSWNRRRMMGRKPFVPRY
jgi:hypothetical protein